MSIKYSLVPNHLTDDPDDYMAVVHGQVTRTEEDIINEMLDRGSTVTRVDILSVLTDYRASFVKFLRAGDNVKTPLVEARASMTGRFESKYDRFDPSRHELKYGTASGSDLEVRARPRNSPHLRSTRLGVDLEVAMAEA